MGSAIVSDVLERLRPDAVTLEGFIGGRFNGSRVNRLIHQEEDHLLWPFIEHCRVGWKKNENHPEIRGDWQGEYLGTWLDAAVLSAWNAGDEELSSKISAMVDRFLATQEPDGYLGTYDGDERWESWALWIHAHDIIGLFACYRYTRNERYLEAAVRAADCVLGVFGPGKRSVVQTGGSMGMASSSILEPVIWLYFETGDSRYLEWGRWLVDVDWETERGPHLVSSLTAGRGVARSGNAKGIEMLTNFAGLVELYRATGVKRYLDALEAGWQDIVAHHLYITGSASTGEFFTPDYALRNDGIYSLGETCVSMGWMYFNLSMGRLTGESRFFDMVEQTVYNHLFAAQSPDGKGWAYYVGLRDHKRYRWHIDPECCPTRGVRALAQMPMNMLATDQEDIRINFYESLTSRVELRDGSTVRIAVVSGYPIDGDVMITLEPETEPFSGALKLRIPGWCRSFTCTVSGKTFRSVGEDGYLTIHRTWRRGDIVKLTLELKPVIVEDRIGNNGRVAITRGPLVFAADASFLPAGVLLDDIVLNLPSNGGGQSLSTEIAAFPEAGIDVNGKPAGTVHVLAKSVVLERRKSAELWKEKERYQEFTPSPKVAATSDVTLVPFFEAGNRAKEIYRDGFHIHNEGSWSVTYSVWLPFYCR